MRLNLRIPLLYLIFAFLFGGCSMPHDGWRSLLPVEEGVDAGAETIQFWVGSDDNYRGQGKAAGCGSYILPVDTGVERGADIERDLRIALEALFAPEQDHPAAETFDWIKQLGLSVDSLSVHEGAAQIHLDGGLLGIGSCGDAILEAQILQTIFQFEHIYFAFVNDGVINLRQIVEMSDRFSDEQLYNWVYERP